MYRPSFTAILSGIFLAYVLHSMYTISKLFFPNTCEKDKLNDPSCLRSSLKTGEESIRFLLLTTLNPAPKSDRDLNFFGYLDVKDLLQPSSATFKVNIPKKVRDENGTIFLAVFSLPLNKETSKMEPSSKWSQLMRHSQMTYSLTTLTQYQIPEAETFNLLGSKEEGKEQALPKPVISVPMVHIRSKIHLNIMTEQIDLLINDVPGEIFPLVRAYQPDTKSKQEEYLPLLYINELSQRLRDLVIVNKTSESYDVEFLYSPIGFGKLRLFVQFSQSLSSLQSLGFTPKDADEVKGIFADTNLFLLLVTFGVSAVHLLFDFLAFKNDLAFWSKKRSMVGLSTRTVVWRAFSQSIIFLYLMDENTSLLVLVPSGIGALIEMWKVSKAFKVHIQFQGFCPKLSMESEMSSSEAETKRYDADAMTYLSYILYPLCIGGAVYSLIYTPHKSWYSWTIESLVNGVYAFGFLFMLPQLFVNYKLKSVAHLPWRAFMYKAFNTFIDDLFAFIITMPTAHRIACFRDDIVFLIYLYQRYLYPVDQSRIDLSGMIEETCDGDEHKTKEASKYEKPQTRQRKHLKKE